MYVSLSSSGREDHVPDDSLSYGTDNLRLLQFDSDAECKIAAGLGKKQVMSPRPATSMKS
jgi:hypothetical protein